MKNPSVSTPPVNVKSSTSKQSKKIVAAARELTLLVERREVFVITSDSKRAAHALYLGEIPEIHPAARACIAELLVLGYRGHIISDYDLATLLELSAPFTDAEEKRWQRMQDRRSVMYGAQFTRFKKIFRNMMPRGIPAHFAGRSFYREVHC